MVNDKNLERKQHIVVLPFKKILIHYFTFLQYKSFAPTVAKTDRGKKLLENK